MMNGITKRGLSVLLTICMFASSVVIAAESKNALTASDVLVTELSADNLRADAYAADASAQKFITDRTASFEDWNNTVNNTIAESYQYIPKGSLTEEETGVPAMFAADAANVDSELSSDEEQNEIINHIIPAYETFKSTNESVSVSTGELNIYETIASIPGINGLDLELGIKYNTKESWIDKAMGCYSTEYGFDENYNYVPIGTYPTYEVSRRVTENMLAAGWVFDLPYITEGIALYIPEYGYYSIVKNKIMLNETVVGYLTLQRNKEYSVINGNAVRHGITDKNGYEYYFDYSGNILRKEDRFGNKIDYTYTNGILSSISDDFGRTITITCEELVSIEGVKYIITEPDGSTTELKCPEISFGNKASKTCKQLESITRNSGSSSLKTSFTYTFGEATVDTEGQAAPYVLLSAVFYPDYSSITYSYDDSVNLFFYTFYHTTYRVTERIYYYDTTDYTTYTYTGDYSGIGDYSTMESVDDFEYSVLVTGNCVAEEYTFNVDNNVPGKFAPVYEVEKKVYSDINATNEVYTTVTNYSEGMSYPETESITYPGLNTTLVTSYEYDEMKNIVKHTDPHAMGSTSDLYISTFTYDDTYNLPVEAEYKTAENTTVRKEYTLSTDKKSVVRESVYVNNIEKERAEYSYDTFGNVTYQKTYFDIDDNIFTEIVNVYTDISSPVLDNLALKKQYVSCVCDADNSFPVSVELSYTYDIMGNVLKSTDANGNDTEYAYDGFGRTVEINYPDDYEITYTYDDYSQSVVFNTRDGYSKKHYFAGNGNVGAIFKLNSSGEPVATEKFVYHHDGRGRPQESAVYTDADSSYLVYNFYDCVGRPVSVSKTNDYYSTDSSYFEDCYYHTQYTYTYETINVNGTSVPCNVTTYWEGEDGTSLTAKEKTYSNVFGETVMTCSVLNGENIGEIYYTYDKNGNNTEKFYLDAAGQKVLIAEYGYDYAGRMISEKNFNGNTRYITYDAVGNKLSESDFKGKTAVFTYDKLSRLVKQETPLDNDTSSVVKYYYDSNGNVIKTLQSNNADNSDEITYRTVETDYDRMNNPTDVTTTVSDVEKTYVHYEYNPAGKVTAMYEGMSVPFSEELPEDVYKLTEYSYDYFGNPAEILYADGEKEQSVYDAYGKLIRKYNRNDYEYFEYRYDIFGRVRDEVRAVPGELSTGYTANRYSYDICDNVVKIEEYLVDVLEYIVENGETVGMAFVENKVGDLTDYTYDTLGRVLTETNSVNNKTVVKTYTYDEFGSQIRAVITLNGTTIYDKSSTYDEFLRLETVSQCGKTTTYTYDANGNLATETTGTAVTSYSYNDANMVTAMSTESDDETITSFSYTYYTDGNQSTKTDTILNKVSAYHYDGAGQLISEIYSDLTSDEVLSSKMYFYDPSGNRIMLTEYDGETFKTVASEYNCLNQLVSSTDSETNETTTYAYDDYGNLINDGKYEYSYDAYFNRLDCVRNIETNETTYYDYYVDGLRKRKDNTYFIWLDGNMVYEFTDNDSNTYTYGHRLISSDDAKYVLNAHGDVVALLNDSNDIAKHYDYDAFGNELNIDSTDTNPFRYCAEYFDLETGQIYLRNRYYQPVVGRFSQRDIHWNTANMIYGDDPRFKEYDEYLGLNDYTVKLIDYAAVRQSGNLYGYCLNNPIFFVDSFGTAVTGYGLSASAALYFGYECQVLWVTDDKGNFALMTVNGGISSYGLSLSGVAFYFPDMPEVYDLQGSGFGVSGGANGIGGGVLVAGEYIGTIFSIGLGAEVDLSLAADVTYTYLTPIHGNVEDISNFFKSIINFFLPKSLEI